MTSRLTIAGAVIAAITTPIVIIGASVLLFLNPVWVGFEQQRSDVTAWTGYTQAQVDQVTGSVLSDLVFGPPRFDVQVNGAQVLDPREVGHMADVRAVMMSLGALALVALLALAATAGLVGRKRIFWHGVEIGSTALIGGVVVVGVFAILFFDQVFLIFHDIFFAPGTFAFDPSKEKLVQLFPDAFWSDTSLALGGVILLLGVLTRAVSRRLARKALPGSLTAEPVAHVEA